MNCRLPLISLLLNILFTTQLQAQAGWSGQMPVNEPASHFSCSPIISFDSEGNPWAVWQGSDPTAIYCNRIYYSRWNGSDWEPEGVLYSDTLIVSRPWIVGDYEGIPWAVWKKPTGDGVNGPDIMYSRWNGSNWDPPEPVSHTVRNDYAPVLATGGGELWVIWYGDTTGINPVRYNTYASRWNGTGWDPEMLVTHPDTGYDWGHEWEGLLAVDDSGHPHVVWNTYYDGNIFYRTFDGESWLDPVAIVDTTDELWGVEPVIAIDDSGTRHVAFEGRGHDIYYSSSSDGVSWSAPYAIYSDDVRNESPSIACSGPDNVWVTWFREISLWDLHVWVSHFDGVMWSDPIELDNDSTEADISPVVTLDSLGYPWVIWSGIWDNIYNYYNIWYNRYLGNGIWESPMKPKQGLLRPTLRVSPNPFGSRLQLTFSLPPTSVDAEPVSLKVFSVSGREVRTLFGGPYESGRHVVVWDGDDDLGRTLAPGVYFCKMKAGEYEGCRKLVLMR